MDLFGITDDNVIKQVFLSSGTGDDSWQIWQKPKNCKFVSMFAMGGGAGGGAGFSALNGAAGGGGGGGGSSVTKAIYHANTLPDRLYVRVGRGGFGGTNSPVVAATNGTGSYVSIRPLIAGNQTIISSGGDSTLGGAGTSAAGGAGGGNANFAQAGVYLSFLGNLQTQAGQIGTNGGFNVPTNYTITLPFTGGAGGGGVTAGGVGSAGANMTGDGIIPTALGGTAGTGAGVNGGNGSNGFKPSVPSFDSFIRSLFINTGGAGGGSSILANGGRGGDGGFGCGGGGGGASYAGTTNGGAGGNGGDGIVIISSW